MLCRYQEYQHNVASACVREHDSVICIVNSTAVSARLYLNIQQLFWNQQVLAATIPWWAPLPCSMYRRYPCCLPRWAHRDTGEGSAWICTRVLSLPTEYNISIVVHQHGSLHERHILQNIQLSLQRVLDSTGTMMSNHSPSSCRMSR